MREKAERPEPIVVRHENDAFAGEHLAVVAWLGAGTACEAAAVGPHDDRAFFRCRFRTRPDIDVEAVFAGRGPGGIGSAILHAGRAELVRRPDAVPMGGRLRRTP